MANQLLLKHDLIFSGRAVLDSVRALNYHKSSVVWTPPNPRWRTLRTLLNTQMMTVEEPRCRRWSRTCATAPLRNGRWISDVPLSLRH
ncbi:hypothetical protein AAC387_Pa08g1867 [Persea americana]